MRSSGWSSDVCSSDPSAVGRFRHGRLADAPVAQRDARVGRLNALSFESAIAGGGPRSPLVFLFADGYERLGPAQKSLVKNDGVAEQGLHLSLGQQVHRLAFSVRLFH